jgi:hypothetical protein
VTLTRLSSLVRFLRHAGPGPYQPGPFQPGPFQPGPGLPPGFVPPKQVPVPEPKPANVWIPGKHKHRGCRTPARKQAGTPTEPCARLLSCAGIVRVKTDEKGNSVVRVGPAGLITNVRTTAEPQQQTTAAQRVASAASR